MCSVLGYFYRTHSGSSQVACEALDGRSQLQQGLSRDMCAAAAAAELSGYLSAQDNLDVALPERATCTRKALNLAHSRRGRSAQDIIIRIQALFDVLSWPTNERDVNVNW